jgi:hypothetical protein
MTRLIGMAYVNAATPATTSVARMKSVAYATDDRASDERTASPVTRESRSWCASDEGMGLPTRRRLNENAESSDIRAPDGCVKVCFRENADGVS